MCGRFTLRTPIGLLAEQFRVDIDRALSPRLNIAPTQQVAVVRELFDKQSGSGESADGRQRRLDMLRWGLVPSWAKELKIGSSMINARAETVADKPAFRTAFRRRRCLIPADGYYEWQKLGRQKQPHLIRRRDEQPFAFAGLWEQWWGGGDGTGEPIETCTIITTSSNELTRPIHDRMPVILHPVDYDLWLDPQFNDRQRLESLLLPLEGDELIVEPVGSPTGA
jgi:putative SOS response-associated peptidase YedK